MSFNLSTATVEETREHLAALGLNPDGNRFQCPCHDDAHASATFHAGRDVGTVVRCHAACEQSDLVAAINGNGQSGQVRATPKKKLVKRRRIATYSYEDETGRVLYRKHRYEPKSFTRSPKGYSGPFYMYEIGDVLEAIEEGETIYVVEGEKDADRLIGEGYYATTNVEGAGTWRRQYTDQLRGSERVVVVADHDEPGREHAWKVADSLAAAGVPVHVVEAAEGKDVSDHLDAGFALDDLRPIERAAPVTVLGMETESVGEAQRVDWLVEPVVGRNHVTLLVGDAKSGKTLVAQVLAIDLVLGRPVFGRWPVAGPGRVLWIDTEMGPLFVDRIRCLRVGADVDPPTLAGFKLIPQEAGFIFKEHGRWLLSGAQSYDLVVIDSLVGVFTGRDENNATEVRQFYNQFIAPLRQRVAIFVLAHTTKDGRGGVRGSGDFAAQVDRVLKLEKISAACSPGKYVAVLREERSRVGSLEPIEITVEGDSQAEDPEDRVLVASARDAGEGREDLRRAGRIVQRQQARQLVKKLTADSETFTRRELTKALRAAGVPKEIVELVLREDCEDGPRGANNARTIVGLKEGLR